MKQETIRVALYTRVSTKHQSCERQVRDLTRYAAKHGYQVVEIFEEVCSGRSRLEKRPVLQNLLEQVREGRFDKVLVTEISRLSREPKVQMVVRDTLEQAHVALYVRNLDMESILPNGRINSMMHIVIAVYTEVEKNYSEDTVDRIYSGLRKARESGKRLGRPPGATSARDMIKKYPKATVDLENGLSLRKVATLHGLSKSTVQNLKKCVDERRSQRGKHRKARPNGEIPVRPAAQN
ncbi:recombinase family protein [Catalinimonas alkaloidigena]|nr:recombinase family protein [Catalinimonas alkaloidigena]